MILVGIGGGIGAISRFALGNYINSKHSSLFPYGNFFINIIGSFIIGLLHYLYLEKTITTTSWLLFEVGFLGGFTTFSTFGYETIHLIISKKYKIAIFYIIFSTILSIVGAYIGFHMLR
jgi:fluoride exporter